MCYNVYKRIYIHIQAHYTFWRTIYMARKYVNPRAVKLTQSEFDYRLQELEKLSDEIARLEETKKVLAQDGTDDENPAYGYNNQQLASAYQRRESLKTMLSEVEIVEPQQGGEGEFSECAKAVSLRCTYSADEISERRLAIGHELGNITPASPLFKFLIGKKVGYKGMFENKTPMGTTSYTVEILDIEF